MGNPPRSRKRVRPPCRAPDGSAFTKCDECGGSVAVALMDMHECNMKKGTVKKLKQNPKPSIPKKDKISEQPGSPFVYFMESYSKYCKGRDLIEISREACEKWKKMSTTERWPYIAEARKVENAYLKLIHEEEICLKKVMMKQIQRNALRSMTTMMTQKTKNLSTCGIANGALMLIAVSAMWTTTTFLARSM